VTPREIQIAGELAERGVQIIVVRTPDGQVKTYRMRETDLPGILRGLARASVEEVGGGGVRIEWVRPERD
jgi:hypothetical protein